MTPGERRRRERYKAKYPSPDRRGRLILKSRLLRRDGNMCAGCRFSFERAALTIDHRVPQSKGGSWDLENLQLMCAPCNQTKADGEEPRSSK